MKLYNFFLAKGKKTAVSSVVVGFTFASLIFISEIRWQVFYIIPVFIRFYIYSHGANLVDHGYFSMIGFIVCAIVFFLGCVYILNLISKLL